MGVSVDMDHRCISFWGATDPVFITEIDWRAADRHGSEAYSLREDSDGMGHY